jgi:primosomal protein N' (replication factor Y)
VIDEEHEPSYKQESTPRYQARDLAVLRASIEGATVILGSATPSLESMYNVEQKKYKLDRLDKRVLDLALPPVETVNLSQEFREQKRYVLFSRHLEKEVETALAKKEQIILFLNRRGYHRSLKCPRCSWSFECPHCGIDLVYHKGGHFILCHLCGFQNRPPECCPDCSFDDIRFQGFGTQQVEEHISDWFPDAIVRRMDTDTMKNRDDYTKTLNAFGKGEIDILVGTQMIAKGLHFPNITVIGLIQADGALSMPDFRAAERTFQLITQVAGRTGRGDKAGKVILQAFNCEHYAVEKGCEQDFDGFLKIEMQYRKELGYPPYTRLARILLAGKNQQQVQEETALLVRKLSQAAKMFKQNILIRGPAPAPLERLKDDWRFHLLISAPNSKTLANFLDKARGNFKTAKEINLTLDVDPMQMM